MEIEVTITDIDPDWPCWRVWVRYQIPGKGYASSERFTLFFTSIRWWKRRIARKVRVEAREFFKTQDMRQRVGGSFKVKVKG